MYEATPRQSPDTIGKKCLYDSRSALACPRANKAGISPEPGAFPELRILLDPAGPGAVTADQSTWLVRSRVRQRTGAICQAMIYGLAWRNRHNCAVPFAMREFHRLDTRHPKTWTLRPLREWLAHAGQYRAGEVDAKKSSGKAACAGAAYPWLWRRYRPNGERPDGSLILGCEGDARAGLASRYAEEHARVGRQPSVGASARTDGCASSAGKRAETTRMKAAPACAEEVECLDILAGGSPCQGFSTPGLPAWNARPGGLTVQVAVVSRGVTQTSFLVGP